MLLRPPLLPKIGAYSKTIVSKLSPQLLNLIVLIQFPVHSLRSFRNPLFSSPRNMGEETQQSKSGKYAYLRSRKILTLAFVEKETEVLLGFKKRGFGQGKWNGFGGKVEKGENIFDAAAREIKEECGLTVASEDLCQFGRIHFIYEGEPTVHEVHCFKTSKFSGDLTESEEMLPKWFPKDEIPYHIMWADDKVWYPLFLADKPSSFKALFLFRGHGEFISYSICDCKTFHDADNDNDSTAENEVLQEFNWDAQMHSTWKKIFKLPPFDPVLSVV